MFGIAYNDLFVQHYAQQTIQITKETYDHKVKRIIREVTGSEAEHYTELWTHESGLRFDAKNPSSGACGIVQALPCSKLPCGLTIKDVECQIRWGLSYVEQRYGSGTQALNFWDENNWY